MKRKPIWFVAGCLAMGSVSTGVLGADEAADAKQSTKTQANAAGQDAAVRTLVRAKTLLDKKVKNEEGKDIGEIEEIVVDSRNGRIAYAVLEFGGFLGLGEKKFAIPFRALSEDSARKSLILNVAKEKLEASRGFDDDNWPDMANETWARDIHKHYGVGNYWDEEGAPEGATEGATPREQPRQRENDVTPDANQPDVKRSDEALKADAKRRLEGQTGQAQRPQIEGKNLWANRVSQMMGKPVMNSENEKVGDIKDLMIDMKHGRVVYAVISDGGTLGIGENLSAVPFAALKVQPDQKQFALNSTKDALKADSFKEDAWPDMSEMHWAQKTHQKFNQEPYWTTFGFAGEDVDANWRQDSQYNKAFAAGEAKPITGKVTSISEFSPASDAPKGRQVVITDDAGKTYTVHLGPVSHLDKKDGVKLEQGQKVTIIAVSGKFENDEVFQARQVITEDGKRHQLRDEQGRAKWESGQRQNRQPGANDQKQQKPQNQKNQPEPAPAPDAR